MSEAIKELTTEEKTDALYLALPAIFREITTQADSYRFNLSRPWIVGDFIYAVDGRIAARIAVTEVIRKLVDDVGFPEDKVTRDRSLMFAKSFDDPNCRWYPRWIGSPDAKPFAICPDCNGFKSVVASNGLYPCYACDSEGIIRDSDDDDCEPGAYRINLFPTWDIQPFYAAILYRHRAQVYEPVAENAKEWGKGSALRFTTPDGAEGRLMPLIPKGAKS
jgi:hypothetical protein